MSELVLLSFVARCFCSRFEHGDLYEVQQECRLTAAVAVARFTLHVRTTCYCYTPRTIRSTYRLWRRKVDHKSGAKSHGALIVKVSMNSSYFGGDKRTMEVDFNNNLRSPGQSLQWSLLVIVWEACRK